MAQHRDKPDSYTKIRSGAHRAGDSMVALGSVQAQIGTEHFGSGRIGTEIYDHILFTFAITFLDRDFITI